jgi:hypothetical protein
MEADEATRGRKIIKSFFVKRIERKIEEHDAGIMVEAALAGGVPLQVILRVMDTPFEEFSEEEHAIYMQAIKGQPVFILFSDILREVYDDMGANRVGWEELAERINDSPIKVLVMYTLYEIDRVGELYDFSAFDEAEDPLGEHGQPREKLNVRRYAPEEKEPWWKKKVF